MAKTLSQTGIVSGQTIKASEISQSIDAFTGVEEYDITISGSLVVTGSLNISGSIINPLTASYAITASHALNVPVTASYAITASHALNVPVTASYAITASHALTGGDDPFPFSGSAVISPGSLLVSGSISTVNGSGGIISGSEIISYGSVGIKSMGRFLDYTVPRGSDAQRTRYDFNKQEGGVTITHGNSDFSTSSVVFSYTTASAGFRIFQPLTVTGQISGSGRIYGGKVLLRASDGDAGSIDLTGEGGRISASGDIKGTDGIFSNSISSSGAISGLSLTISQLDPGPDAQISSSTANGMNTVVYNVADGRIATTSSFALLDNLNNLTAVSSSFTLINAKQPAGAVGLTIGTGNDKIHFKNISGELTISSSIVKLNYALLPTSNPGVLGQLYRFPYEGSHLIAISAG